MDMNDPFVRDHAQERTTYVEVSRVNGDLAVARALGDADFKLGDRMKLYPWNWPEGQEREFTANLVSSEPDLFEFDVLDDWDYLIIACDGLWETLTAHQAVSLVRQWSNEGMTLGEVSRRLSEVCLSMGSTDNVTVLVVRLQ